MTAVVSEEMPARPQGILSGPSLAAEVAQGLPTAVTVAAPLRDGTPFHCGRLAARIAVTFATPTFRPYLADDVIGVEIGRAVKNVLAIASGIAAGRGMGSNARAAVITRGLAEMTRLALALGGRADTLCGLAGVGDLLLTCSSEQSRNFSYGRALGRGDRPEADGGAVVEGKVNAPTIAALARRHRVAMPICEAVCSVVEGGAIDEAIANLMSADLCPEPLGAERQIRIPQVVESPQEWEFASA